MEKPMQTLFSLGLTMMAASVTLAAPPVEQHDALWVSQRVQALQPTTKDRSWEKIGWAQSLTDALRLGKTHRRPIFLFTHDGRLNIGRC
jgi:hypothetical protein